MNQWVPDDRGYRQPDSWLSRPRAKWAGLFLAWVLITGLLSAFHLALLIWPLLVILIWYVAIVIFRNTPPTPRTRRPMPQRQAGVRHGQPSFEPEPRWGEPLPPWDEPEPPRRWDERPQRWDEPPPRWDEPPPRWSPRSNWEPEPEWPSTPPGLPSRAPGPHRPARHRSRYDGRENRDRGR